MSKIAASDRSVSVKKAATRQMQLLARKSGATILQIQKAFGWQPHTGRAAIAVQRKDGRGSNTQDTL